MFPNVVITLQYLSVDPGNFDTEFRTLIQKATNSFTVVILRYTVTPLGR